MNTNEKYSPLTQRLHDAFEHMKDNHSVMFVFWDNWFSDINIIGVKKGAYPWAAYDQAKQVSPDTCHKLLMAFDLKSSFDKQFPQHLASTLETLQYFSMKPLIWIPDRTGIVPERKNKELVTAFLKPSLSIIDGNKDLGPKEEKETQPEQCKLYPSYLQVIK